MLYPLKFKPIYKDYIWGGRNLEKFGKQLIDGIVAESWEVSCHKNGTSIIVNGDYKGVSLPELINRLGSNIIGNSFKQYDAYRFPLLVKFIDAEKNLSVQVHPDDSFAQVNENGEYGKNEVWYIISAKPGARLVYDMTPGTTKECFSSAIKNGTIEKCLKTVEVYPGDTLNIPSGLVHAIGEGIMLVEIQQNSDITYRVYDYKRTDRPLQIEKALQVIDFNSGTIREKYPGLKVALTGKSFKTYIVANRYFAVEVYDISGSVDENADGSNFYIYTFIEGSGVIKWGNNSIEIRAGESVFIPSAMGKYSLIGHIKGLKSYVPDLGRDVIKPLIKNGYSLVDIESSIPGWKQK